mgnify:CR=1 FL=1
MIILVKEVTIINREGANDKTVRMNNICKLKATSWGDSAAFTLKSMLGIGKVGSAYMLLLISNKVIIKNIIFLKSFLFISFIPFGNVFKLLKVLLNTIPIFVYVNILIAII